MSDPNRAQRRFQYKGETYTLEFGNLALAHFEDHTEWSILELFEVIQSAQAGGRPPKLTMLAALVLAGLEMHHPGQVDRETAIAMVLDGKVQAQLFDGMAAAMPDAGPDADDGAEGEVYDPRPPKARSGKKARTGTRSSNKRSKPA